MKCPSCDSDNVIKNGSTHNGKPKRQCNDCGRQFVINPQPNKILGKCF
jgi:transposase-like protein